MKEEIAAEVCDLVRRDTFKVVMRAETPPYVNVLKARFLLTIERKITGEVLFKAIYVIEGHRDRLKESLVLGSQKLQLISVCALVALAAILNF